MPSVVDLLDLGG